MITSFQPVAGHDVADGVRGVDRVDSAADLLISPELVLVDPELAQVARALLPDYDCDQPAENENDVLRDRPSAAIPAPLATGRTAESRVDAGSAESIAPLSFLEPYAGDGHTDSRRRPGRVSQSRVDRRRGPRASLWVISWTVLIVAIVAPVLGVLPFAPDPGANLLRGPVERPDSADTPLRAIAPEERTGDRGSRVPDSSRGGQLRRPAQGDGRAARVRPATRRNESRVADTRRANPRSKRRGGSRRSERKRTLPVLGLVVTAGDGMVTLRWARPPDSHAILILRGRRVRTRGGVTYRGGKVVYRGSATTYKDRGVRNGVAYVYVIVSHDKVGNAVRRVTAIVVPRKTPSRRQA